MDQIMLRNRLLVATGMWKETTGEPLPRLAPGDPAPGPEFELMLVNRLCESATPENAREIADRTWDLVHDRPDADPVKQRVVECHEALAAHDPPRRLATRALRAGAAYRRAARRGSGRPLGRGRRRAYASAPRPRRHRPRRASRLQQRRASESRLARCSQQRPVASPCAASTIRRTSSSTSRWVASEVSETPGSNGPVPVRGHHGDRARSRLMPQRPTILRAIASAAGCPTQRPS